MSVQTSLPCRAVAEQLLALFLENIHVETACGSDIIKLFVGLELWQSELLEMFFADDNDLGDNSDNEADSTA